MNISVLNAIKDNSEDFLVGTNTVTITGFDAPLPLMGTKVSVIPSNSATAGIETVAFIAQQGTTYAFEVDGYDASGNPVTIGELYTTPSSGATAATIAAAIDTIITNSVIGGQFASIIVNGSNGLVLTGTAAYPIIKFRNHLRNPNITVTPTTVGVAATGLGSNLAKQYSYDSEASKFVATDFYTQVVLEVQKDSQRVYSASSTNLNTTYSLFINVSNPTSAGINPVALNSGFLLSADTYGVTKTIGSITALAQGYRMIVQSAGGSNVAISAGALAVTNPVSVTGSITGNILTVTLAATAGLSASDNITGSGILAGTKVLSQLTGFPGGTGTYQVSISQNVPSTSIVTDNNLQTLGVRQGDVLILSSGGGAAFTSSVRSTLIGITSATAATGDRLNVSGAVVFKAISLRPILR